MNKNYWKFYFLITGGIWLFYALTLPIYFYFIFNWGWNEVILWWTTGTLVEFALAFPLWFYLRIITPPSKRVSGLPTCKECGQ